MTWSSKQSPATLRMVSKESPQRFAIFFQYADLLVFHEDRRTWFNNSGQWTPHWNPRVSVPVFHTYNGLTESHVPLDFL